MFNTDNRIIDDDFPIISKQYQELKHNQLSPHNSRGFLLSNYELEFYSLIPRFYDPSIQESLDKLSKKLGHIISYQ